MAAGCDDGGGDAAAAAIPDSASAAELSLLSTVLAFGAVRERMVDRCSTREVRGLYGRSNAGLLRSTSLDFSASQRAALRKECRRAVPRSLCSASAPLVPCRRVL